VEEDLISKKELLELTGISYGQLYRWKRKSLIPEEWFVRKSTFTGQETFFPRREILVRIERIKDMKDDLSLDKLADMFSPNPSDIHMRIEEVSKRNIVADSALQLFLEYHKDAADYGYPCGLCG
jgi:DNA-binding transcriptional MerR regulator